MKPCQNCGAAIGNGDAVCAECRHVQVVKVTTSHTLHEPRHAPPDPDSYSQRPPAWEFFTFLVAFPPIGYLLGGAPVAVLFGILGVLLFCVLTQIRMMS